MAIYWKLTSKHHHSILAASIETSFVGLALKDRKAMCTATRHDCRLGRKRRQKEGKKVCLFSKDNCIVDIFPRS